MVVSRRAISSKSGTCFGFVRCETFGTGCGLRDLSLSTSSIAAASLPPVTGLRSLPSDRSQRVQVSDGRALLCGTSYISPDVSTTAATEEPCSGTGDVSSPWFSMWAPSSQGSRVGDSLRCRSHRHVATARAVQTESRPSAVRWQCPIGVSTARSDWLVFLPSAVSRNRLLSTPKRPNRTVNINKIINNRGTGTYPHHFCCVCSCYK